MASNLDPLTADEFQKRLDAVISGIQQDLTAGYTELGLAPDVDFNMTRCNDTPGERDVLLDFGELKYHVQEFIGPEGTWEVEMWPA